MSRALTRGVLLIVTCAVALLTQAVPVSANPGVDPIRYGDHGAGVVCIQKIIPKVVAVRPLTLDGDFGPKTLAAVKYFQWAVGLRQDGVVGRLTGKALLDAARGAGYDATYNGRTCAWYLPT
jgi:peptidoglycan hydrolase-like protein with peptidoglycan-binding domain